MRNLKISLPDAEDSETAVDLNPSFNECLLHFSRDTFTYFYNIRFFDDQIYLCPGLRIPDKVPRPASKFSAFPITIFNLDKNALCSLVLENVPSEVLFNHGRAYGDDSWQFSQLEMEDIQWRSPKNLQLPPCMITISVIYKNHAGHLLGTTADFTL